MRIFFRKTGRAKYISHLDLQRTMQRALKRAKLPVWETEGFNPHIYLTFALPLSLGIESLCESFDIKMTEEIPSDEIRDRLNAALNDDLRVNKAAEPIYKHTEIQKAEYEIITAGDGVPLEKIAEFLSQNEIIITKKSKKGETQIDLKPLIELKAVSDGKITLLLPAGTGLNINPMQVISAYGAFIGEELQANITRTAVFCAGGEAFS
jgi:radical SAM-linked protein